MPGFATDIKLGPVGKEIVLLGSSTFDYLTGRFSISAGRKQDETENTVGETFTVLLRRFQREFGFQVDGASEDLMWQFDSLNALTQQHMAFIYADSWKINSEEYVTDGLTTVQPMKTNSHLLLDKAYNAAALPAQVSITGVFTTQDMAGAQGGTNYFSSFDRATWRITLNASPGAIGTRVFVNYTYKGALVKLRPPGFRTQYEGLFHPATGAPVWDVAATLKGV
jgi:hypothetical protein